MIAPIDVVSDALEKLQQKYGKLSEDCRSDFSNCLKHEQFEKNQILVRSGDVFDKLFFIHEGSMRAYYIDGDKEITDWFAFENEFISAINSFFSGKPSPHFITTMSPTVASFISASDMSKLCNDHHDFERLSRLITTETMLQLQQRIVALQFKSAAEKYEILLSNYPDIANKVAVGYIASYLGITLETLSRIRSNRKH